MPTTTRIILRFRTCCGWLAASWVILSCLTPADAQDAALRSTDAATSRSPLVRGSVEQIHVIHAPRDATVTVNGPGGFRASATTDSAGGLIVRNLAPGDGYQVHIEGNLPVSESVRVLSREEHPSPKFYAAQRLDPTQGYIKTRDGTLLCYRVVLPDAKVHGNGPYDLLITYSGYQPGLKTGDAHQNRPFEQFSELGYAVAGVNMRGSGGSGGAFDFMEPLTWLDGYDAIEAFAAQPWVDDIALGDQSWPGLTQLFVASTQPPALDAIVAGSVVGDFYRDVFYPGGIPNIGFGQGWAAGRDSENAWPTRRPEINALVRTDPLAAANQALRGQNQNLRETIRQHPFDDVYWQSRSAEELVDRIKVPTLQIVSWQDPQVGGRPAELCHRFADGTPMRLVGINGFHQYWSGAVWDEIVGFLDVYLRQNDRASVAKYESQDRFVAYVESDAQGRPRGRFSLPDFGAAGEGQRFEFGRELAPGDASKTFTTLNYDASRPGSWIAPTQDQPAFTSTVLQSQLIMAGPGSADLWIAADADDVDLQVTLSEVRSDGQEMLVQSGWLRASHRVLDKKNSTTLRPRQLHTADSVGKLTPGEWTLLRVELFPFTHVFREGSRIRIRISGPGGGSNAWPWAYAALPGSFEVRIGHDGNEHTSSVVLPIVHPQHAEIPTSLPDCNGVWLQPCRPLDPARR